MRFKGKIKKKPFTSSQYTSLPDESSAQMAANRLSNHLALKRGVVMTPENIQAVSSMRSFVPWFSNISPRGHKRPFRVMALKTILLPQSTGDLPALMPSKWHTPALVHRLDHLVHACPVARHSSPTSKALFSF